MVRSPGRHSRGSSNFSLLLQVLKLRIWLSCSDLSCLPSFPFPHRVVTVEYRCQGVATTDNVLIHML